MRTSRIYLPIQNNDIPTAVVITGEKAHYLRNVLRIKVNQNLRFFIPSGSEYEGVITAVKKHEIHLSTIKPLNKKPPTATIEITLIQAISSGERMDYTVQKAAELGCKKLFPVTSDFCSHRIATHKQQKKHQHWQNVAISACEQSGRNDIMQIQEIKPISAVITAIPHAIYLEPGAGNFIHQLPADQHQQQTVFIGPEGGFSPTEIACFKNKKYLGIELGPRVLRTETVAPVILSALHTLYGDFKQPVG